MSSSLETARQWCSKAHLALQAAGFTAHATIDPVEARAHLNAGDAVILVEVERTIFETWTVTEHQLRIIVISNLSNPLEGWEELEPLIKELKEPLELETATLSMYQTEASTKTYPALLCTTSVAHID